MASDALHELSDLLGNPTLNLHRAIVSLMEEMEAVDWYQQRAEACTDDALRAVLTHNKDEEVEHAMMVLEWIRRNSPIFDEHARRYLFSEGPITATEASGGAPPGTPGITPSPAHVRADQDLPIHDGSLGIGALKGYTWTS
jgi:ferritin-like protein